MSYVVSFVDFQPEPRYDLTPWARVIIQEGPVADGPWTQIDDILLLPVDTDPANPKVRSFSTTHAQLATGWYRITFRDASGNDALPVAPVHMAADEVLNYTPSVGQVARHILSRTKDQYGNQINTFSDTTEPTAEQVHELAIEAAGKVSLLAGDEIPDSLLDEARSVAAIRTAMDVELTYFSDQVTTGRSIYSQLKELYEEELKALQNAIANISDTGEVVSMAPATKPQYGFPDASNFLEGRW